MVEKNYTIPISEAFDIIDGCPICRLHKKLEFQSLDYVMGAAMMEPAVRVETNKTGFCRKHYEDMVAMGNRLSLALMLESYLDQLKTTLEKTVTAAQKRSSRRKNSPPITTAVHRANSGCFVCERVAHTLDRYAENLLYMWRTMPEFREKFEVQPHLCLNHASLLIRTVERNPQPMRRFKKEVEPSFEQAVGRLAAKRLDVLSDEISRFCKSFDYRFSGQDLGDAKQGVEHAIAWLLGDGK